MATQPARRNLDAAPDVDRRYETEQEAIRGRTKLKPRKRLDQTTTNRLIREHEFDEER